MIQMVSGLTPDVKGAIAPPSHRERALISWGVEAIFGTAAQTMYSMTTVILVLKINTHLSLWRTEMRGVVLVALRCQIYVIRAF